jgi:hypothetical protein
MTSPTKAPPHLRTSRALPACTKHPTDGGCYRRSSGRSRSYLQSKTRDQFLRPLPSEGRGHTFESCRVRQFFLIFQRDMRARAETPALRHSSE